MKVARRKFLHISVLCLPFQNIIYALKSICISVLVSKSGFISCPVNYRRHTFVHGSRMFAFTNKYTFWQSYGTLSGSPLCFSSSSLADMKTLKYHLRVRTVSVHSGTILINAEYKAVKSQYKADDLCSTRLIPCLSPMMIMLHRRSESFIICHINLHSSHSSSCGFKCSYFEMTTMLSHLQMQQMETEILTPCSIKRLTNQFKSFIIHRGIKEKYTHCMKELVSFLLASSVACDVSGDAWLSVYNSQGPPSQKCRLKKSGRDAMTSLVCWR